MNQFVDECVELLDEAEQRLKAEKAAARCERQRLAWLGFYNTATLIFSRNGGPPGFVKGVVDVMMKEYNERWEIDA